MLFSYIRVTTYTPARKIFNHLLAARECKNKTGKGLEVLRYTMPHRRIEMMQTLFGHIRHRHFFSIAIYYADGAEDFEN